MAKLWAYDPDDDRWVEIYQEQHAIHVLICGLDSTGELVPLQCDADGKLITSSGA